MKKQITNFSSILIAVLICFPVSAQTYGASQSTVQYLAVPGGRQTTSAVPTQDTNSVAQGQLPSFPYDRKLDPAKNNYQPHAHDPLPSDRDIGLGTNTGGELGIQISKYRYQEHLVSDQELMHLSGSTFGLTFGANKTFKSGWFAGGDVRAAYGSHDYTGGDQNILTSMTIPSTHKDESDWLFDLRGIVGHDFIFADSFWGHVDMSLAPYAGLGFRYLYNDGRGADSNGVSGYERYSHYLYLPVGITPRFRLTDLSRLSLNVEYDQLLTGWQISKLGDASAGQTDINNDQNTGYGLRGSIMYERKSWSFGPFFNYWNINQSVVACNNAFCGVEPHNQTIEYGVQGRYRFSF